MQIKVAMQSLRAKGAAVEFNQMDACTMTSDVTWGNFQSVIQLSAALNAAFYTLLDHIQSDVEIEGRRIKVLIAQLQRRARIDDAVRGDLTGARLLFGDLTVIGKRYADVTYSVFRPACAIACLASVILLFVSSYLYNCKLSLIGTGLIFLSVVPFLAAILFAAKVYAELHFSVTRTRLQLHSKLK